MSTDPINELHPGTQVTPEQKAAMAAANASETALAHKMAADRRSQDAMNEPPLERALADSIKEKLAALPPEEGTATE